MQATEAADRPRTMFGHPLGLPIVMALKVWEIFSYQGMRAFLIFYLIAAFSIPDASAALLFGSYAALTLATSVIGGAIADRWLGEREPVVAGACLIMAGHLILAMQHLAVGLNLVSGGAIFQIFCAGLACIAIGTGLLKPNILNLIGGFYRTDDPRREIGYYIYYMGVNLGSFAAPLLCGWVAHRYGWNWGFAAAAIGMAIGLVVLLAGLRHVRRVDDEARAAVEPKSRIGIYAGIALAIVAASALIQHGLMLGALLAVTMIAGCVHLFAIAARDPSGADRASVTRLFALLPVPFAFVILFEQFALVINLFADRLVDRTLLGIEIAASQLLALNALFVLALLPPLSFFWSRLRRTGREPPLHGKFAIGFLCMGSGFAMVASAVHIHPAGAMIPVGWVVATYMLITMGEIMIAPLAYSAVGRTVPRHLQGVGTGLLLLSFAFGNLCAGSLAALAAIPAGMAADDMAAIYGRYFVMMAGIGGVAAAFSLGLGRIFGPAPDQAIPSSSGKAKALVMPASIEK